MTVQMFEDDDVLQGRARVHEVDTASAARMLCCFWCKGGASRVACFTLNGEVTVCSAESGTPVFRTFKLEVPHA